MKFSVLLPTRNGGRFLDHCMRSILEQDFDDFELIVSDNANTDETPSVLAMFLKDPRVKALRLDAVVPVTDNWNNALRVAKGDYLLMMGDDDCLLPGCLRRLAEVTDKYGQPDCIVFNAYSYVAPGSIADNVQSYYSEAHFNFGPDFTTEGVMEPERCREIVTDMFRFRVRIPLNMQTTLVARRTAERIVGGIFVAPFPDHYALNSLLLKGDRWIFLPERLLLVGVSPKSFGHYVYSNQQGNGLGYLGITPDFPGRLPGSELTNGMMRWLLLLKERYPEDLAEVPIDRGGYVRRQVYAWLMQWRLGGVTFWEFLSRFRLLRRTDWAGLIGSIFDATSWKRALSMLSSRSRSGLEQQWSGLRPLEGIGDIRAFARWVSESRSG